MVATWRATALLSIQLLTCSQSFLPISRTKAFVPNIWAQRIPSKVIVLHSACWPSSCQNSTNPVKSTDGSDNPSFSEPARNLPQGNHQGPYGGRSNVNQTFAKPPDEASIDPLNELTRTSEKDKHDVRQSDVSQYDRDQIELYWDQIMPNVSYLGTETVAKIYHALTVAYLAHRGQTRKSGEPFIIHPVQVCLLLAGLKMDGETVIAGLLHDTVEDTDLTFDQVEKLFGKTVRNIVEGETKVSKLPKMVAASLSTSDDAADEQAENLRQMFVAMTDDYRIIIVKLADRLHNMRTLRHMKLEKQVKISRETLDIFAPLAHRMGIWQFKSELEDTAFMYLYPVEYRRLNRRLRQHQTRFRETLDRSQEILERRLNTDPTLLQQAAKVEVYGRTKELYSLWHKMETKGVGNLDQIVDVVALRVIITPKNSEADDLNEDHASDRGVWLCYHVLGLVQHLPGFQPVPTRVKDYISFPKPNGYQSLHTALMLNGQTIEVQIRTNLMHQVAEYGMASHWAYTDSKRRRIPGTEELYNTPWLSSIKEWQNDRISSRDFVDSVRRELLGKRVFVFLRNGKILNLARGATAIDAAFQIHTEVGLTMHGVEINGKPVPFSYELQNGDVVSILTGQGKPATDWMRYARSRSTRSKLRAYFRTRQKESLKEAGRILLMDYLRTYGPLVEKESFLGRSFKIPETVDEIMSFLPGKTRYDSADELLVYIGSQHNRSVLHKIVSQIFEVPKKILVEAEQTRREHPLSSVYEAVHEQRRFAQDSEEAVTLGSRSRDFLVRPLPVVDGPTITPLENLLLGLDIKGEDADSEHVCEDCLPVHGDQIIGTRPTDDESAVTIVHRYGCLHAQRAINKVHADMKFKGLKTVAVSHRVDSVSLRRQNGYFWKPKSKAQRTKRPMSANDVPVKLKWSEGENDDVLYLAEVVIHSEDRKLLLADCSEVVSEMVEIVRTGSLTTDEHATLIFLVKVTGLVQLQQLMDRLGQVRSVMSVERRFGSELM